MTPDDELRAYLAADDGPHRRPCINGDHCGEPAHCPPQDPCAAWQARAEQIIDERTAERDEARAEAAALSAALDAKRYALRERDRDVLALREEARRLREEAAECDPILTRQGDLLTGVANALRGDPPPLTTWSHHDLPELAAAERARADAAERELIIASRASQANANAHMAAERRLAEMRALADDFESLIDYAHEVYEGTDTEPAECTDECPGCAGDRLRSVLDRTQGEEACCDTVCNGSRTPGCALAARRAGGGE